MITLSTDRKLTVLVLGDTPTTKNHDGTSAIQNWATNTIVAAENGEDGLTLGFTVCRFIWNCLATNLDGNTVTVPTHIAMRTIAFNDQVAFPVCTSRLYKRIS